MIVIGQLILFIQDHERRHIVMGDAGGPAIIILIWIVEIIDTILKIFMTGVLSLLAKLSKVIIVRWSD